jgi:hypothetical protein
MAPAASTTVECPYRAAHGAVIVRLVHDAPVTRPRTHTQSAHAAACAPIYKYRRSPPCHGRARTHAHTHFHARARTHARTHSNARTVEDDRTERANTRRGVNAESRARARNRTARICSWAHGRYRRGGSARASAAESAVESAAESLPIACVHARMHLRYRTQSGDAVTHRYPPPQAWPNCLSHLAIYPPIYAQTTKRACIRMCP